MGCKMEFAKLEDVKEYLRIDNEFNDGVIGGYMCAAKSKLKYCTNVNFENCTNPDIMNLCNLFIKEFCRQLYFSPNYNNEESLNNIAGIIKDLVKDGNVNG